MNQPIDPVELYHDFECEPFQPRRVRLVDGGVLEIPLREMVVKNAQHRPWCHRI